MKSFFIFFITFQCVMLSAQNNRGIEFDSNTPLKEGIYTSYLEVINNKPKYHEVDFEFKSNPLLGKMSIYYYDELHTKFEFTDSLFMIVFRGQIFVKRKSYFFKLIKIGPISTYIIETIYDSGTSNSRREVQIFYFDVMTGETNRLTPSNIDHILKRDSLLYSTYSDLSAHKKNKTLYSFILKYNKQNPIFIHLD